MGQKTNPSALRLYLKSDNPKNRKRAALNFGANLHAHNFSKKLQLQLQLAKILEEIFNKAGFILANFKIFQAQQKVKTYLTIYLRKTTAKQDSFKFENKETNKSIEKSRRLHWTSRELVWQELSRNFIENLSQFFETYLANSENKEKTSQSLEFQPFFQILQPDSSSLQSLDSQLRYFQRLPFYNDAINILAIIGKENANPGTAELLAKFLSLELVNINNPQILLDFLSNAFSILIPETSLNSQSQLSITKPELDSKKTKKNEILQEDHKKKSRLGGVKIQIKGALASFDRATALKFQIGSIPFNELKASIDYSFQEVKAKRGVLSIKVWLHFIRP